MTRHENYESTSTVTGKCLILKHHALLLEFSLVASTIKRSPPEWAGLNRTGWAGYSTSVSMRPYLPSFRLYTMFVPLDSASVKI